MKKDETLQDYQRLFENDGVTLPESLSKDAVVQKLNELQMKQDKKKVRLIPKIAAVAAAVAVVVTSAALIPWTKNVATVPVTPQTQEGENSAYTPLSISKPAAALSQFSSDADLKAYFQNLYQKRKASGLTGFFAETAKDSAISGTSPTVAYAENIGAKDSMADSANDIAAENYGKTNTRTEGVDEGDVIKNDGRYLYICGSDHVSIVDTRTMQRVYQSELKPKDKDARYVLNGLYVQGNRLVVTGALYKNEETVSYRGMYDSFVDSLYPYYGWQSNAVTFVFDITDRSRPALERTVTQDGSVTASRMVGSMLYTVTRYDVDVDEKKNVDKNYAPKINGVPMTCGDVYVKDPDASDTSYIVLTAWDTADKTSEVQKVSLLGPADDIYCSTDTLYVLNSKWAWDAEAEEEFRSTELYAFGFQDGTLTLRASGVVPGLTENQYAVDQYGGFLRITTTDYDFNKDVDVSSLYVLDGDLKIIGALKDFAEDEQVKSTRFMGNIAYVVTFRNTDPLFAIDLSDPSSPTILGSVKLPGFSSYLHPVSDKLLVGIGYSGDEDSANFDSVKVSLFDVSNPKAPKELDSHIIKGASSDVQFNAKALVYDSERGILGFPVVYNIYGKDGQYAGVRRIFKMLTVNNKKLVDEKGFAHGGGSYDYDPLFRGTYIDSRVYTIDSVTVKEFDLNSGELLRSLTYDTREVDDDVVLDDANDDAAVDFDAQQTTTMVDDTTTTKAGD